MRISRKQTSAYTVAEMIIAGGISVILSAGLMIFTSSSLRMIARNLATNHSHETARGSIERMLFDLHNSASRYQLINFDGTTYTDVSATASTDQDSYSQQYISARANGVRFLRKGGGPFKLTGNGSSSTVGSGDTILEFDFLGGAYTPTVGDKLQIPLLNRDFDIVSPNPPATDPVHTSGNKWKFTVNYPIGFSIITATGTTGSGVAYTNPITTGTFYQRVGYTVLNNQLRFHSRLTDPPYPATIITTGPNADVPLVIRRNVTSPKPFALLFPTSSSAITNALNLRVSLESYDTQYGARLFRDGTTTLQAIIPSRNQPPILSSN